MGKGILNLSVNSLVVEEAKSRGINISAMVEAMLQSELGIAERGEKLSQEEVAQQLKFRLANLTEELIRKNKEIKEKENIIQELKEKIEKIDSKKTRRFIPVDELPEAY